MNNTQEKMPHGLIVLSCTGISKVFPICDVGASWRVLFGKTKGKMFTALNNISLSVPKGKFVGILGRNGAGKSTLLRTLGGVYTPTSGKVKVNGQLSGLFEMGGFGNRYITGREFAKRTLELQGAKRSQLDKLIAEIQDFSELEESFDQQVYTYSTGMAARLYFATATALQHDIYLVDEILSVGDEHFQAKCWQRLRERFTQGASGILVTHDWSAILKLCEEAHILEHGTIVQSGRSDKIVQMYLKLPFPERGIARFCSTNPERYVLQSGKDAELIFDVELDKNVPIDFGYSIELLQIGIGWEILLIQNPTPLINSKGTHQVCIKIGKLPLAPGRFFLNMFLATPREPGSSSAYKVYDSLTWTLGNGIELIVEGKKRSSALVIPMTWQAVN